MGRRFVGLEKFIRNRDCVTGGERGEKRVDYSLSQQWFAHSRGVAYDFFHTQKPWVSIRADRLFNLSRELHDRQQRQTA